MKLPDLNANDVDAAMHIIAGTARSMGVEVGADGRQGYTNACAAGRS